MGDLNHLENWPEKVKLMQKNWIGMSEGAEIKFKLFQSKLSIDVFTTRPRLSLVLVLLLYQLNIHFLQNFQMMKNF